MPVKRPASHRLTREHVFQAAEAIVDRVGREQLTMDRVALSVGVKTPSLYTHVASLDAIRAELQLRAMRALGARMRTAAMGTAREPGMRVLADCLRRYATDHPGLYDLATREPLDREAFLASTADAGMAVGAVIASFGVHDDDFVLRTSFFSALHGVLVLEKAGFFGDAVDSSQVYEHVLDAILAVLTATR